MSFRKDVLHILPSAQSFQTHDIALPKSQLWLVKGMPLHVPARVLTGMTGCFQKHNPACSGATPCTLSEMHLCLLSMQACVFQGTLAASLSTSIQLALAKAQHAVVCCRNSSAHFKQ